MGRICAGLGVRASLHAALDLQQLHRSLRSQPGLSRAQGAGAGVSLSEFVWEVRWLKVCECVCLCVLHSSGVLRRAGVGFGRGCGGA